MPTLTITHEINDGASTTRLTETITAGLMPVLSEAIPANQTNLEVHLEFLNAKLKGFIIWSDVAMTIETNDGGSPQETITLVANSPYYWNLAGSRMGSAASPFAGDVTSIFVTNTTAGTLNIRPVVDPT